MKVKPKQTLVLTYVGFKTKEIFIKNQKTLNVILEEDNQPIEDVVIVGYGAQDKKVSYEKRKVVIRGFSSMLKQHETYAKMEENKFKKTATDPVSTFSVDVDRASYSNIRRILNNGQFPNKDAVRIEEMINYFEYQYPEPQSNSKTPLSITTQLSHAPWNQKNYLLQVGLQAKKINLKKRQSLTSFF